MPAPLITIKKPDGSIEKISLDEFKARQKKMAVPPPAAKSFARPPVEPPAKPQIEPPAKPPAGPSVKQPVKTPAAPSFSKTDASSLLEEEVPAKSSGQSLISSDKIKEADEIIRKLNISLPPHLVGRLRRQISLRLKDVRGEDETKEWLTRSDKELGVGLNEAQAEIVLKVCRDFSAKSAKVPTGPVTPLRKSVPPVKALAKEEEMTPQKYVESNTPATAAPYAAFVRAPAAAKEVKKFDDLVKIRETSAEPSPQIKAAAARPLVRDIAPAKPTSLSPVDEIRVFTLTDFRRLSSVPAEAASRLKQKFINLRDESYVLFLDALDAWKVSPLRLDYLSRVNEAINAAKPLDQVLSDKDKIQLNEIRALIEMEKELG